MASKDAIVAALEYRYDHFAARAVFRELLATAGLEEQKTYGQDEIKKLAEGLVRVGDRVEAVVDRLNGIAEKEKPKVAEPAPTAAEEKPAAAKPAAAKPAAAKPAAAKPAAKAAKKGTASRSRAKS